MEDMFRVGVIANTHGIRGEVKVYPTTDDVTRYKKLKEVLLDTGKEYKTLEIASTRFFKNLVIVKFKGIDNINDIEQYKGHDLYVTRENAKMSWKQEPILYTLSNTRGKKYCFLLYRNVLKTSMSPLGS